MWSARSSIAPYWLWCIVNFIFNRYDSIKCCNMMRNAKCTLNAKQTELAENANEQKKHFERDFISMGTECQSKRENERAINVRSDLLCNSMKAYAVWYDAVAQACVKTRWKLMKYPSQISFVRSRLSLHNKTGNSFRLFVVVVGCARM